MRSASGDRRGGAGAGGREGNVALEVAAGGLVVAEARDLEESCRRENNGSNKDHPCFAIIRIAGQSIKMCL